ncbi:MAG: helix-turn-helix transcriptional regulator [Lachnospiraceae bacterium]|nr:helix-turn-helix transcriptional regulator [Lachnospiraceae bacterium]
MINAADVFYRNPDDIAETGIMIQQMRKQLGLSQMELGTRIGMDGREVSRYETGGREMGITTFFQFAEALGCDTEMISPKRLRKKNINTEKTEKIAVLAERLKDSDQDLLIQIAERMAEKA